MLLCFDVGFFFADIVFFLFFLNLNLTEMFKKLMILFVLGLLCLFCRVNAQDAPVGIVPLKIGDRVPEALMATDLQVYAGGKVAQVRLSVYREKLLILDFWATWCAACIPEMYRLDSLGKVFGGRFVSLPVTYQGAGEIRTFEKVQGRGIRSVVSDDLLKYYFPHRSVPHQVWVKDGKVLAIAAKAEASMENIELALSGKELKFREKSEQMDFDRTRPLFVAGNGGDGRQLLAQSVISGYVQGISNTDAVSVGRGFIFQTNARVVSLYAKALQEMFPPNQDHARVRIEASDSLVSRLVFTGPKAQEADWDGSNRYCYNLVLPAPVSRGELLGMMKADLDRFFGAHLGLKVALERREVMCRVLKVVGETKKLGERVEPASGEDLLVLSGQKLSDFISMYAYRNMKSLLPVVDRSGIKGEVNLELRTDLRDLKGVNRELAKFGLGLVDEPCETEMMIFSDIPAGAAFTRIGGMD